MNWYAASFLFLALLIMPLRFSYVTLLNSKHFSEWSVSAYGLPLIMREMRGKLKKKNDIKPDVPAGFRLFSIVWHAAEHRRALTRLLLRQRVIIRFDIMLRSAALRALGYSAADTLLMSLSRCGAIPKAFRVYARCNMSEQGEGAKMTCIVYTRLGSLLLATALLAAALISAARRGAADRRKQWSIQSTT